MRKKQFLTMFIMLFVLTILLTGCGGSSEPSAGSGDSGVANGSDSNQEAKSEEPKKIYKWIAGDVVPEGDLIAQSMDYFAKRVNELSNGQIEVEVHHAGSLGADRTLIENTINGTIQVSDVGQSLLAGWYKPAEMWTFPYLFKSLEHKDRVWDTIKEEYSNEVAQATGVRPITSISRAPRMLTVNKVVKTPADMKGLKIRVPETPVWMETFERFGATPTPLPFPELYQSLKTGIIDGQENPIDLSYNSGIFEVNTHLSKLEHMMQDAIIIINEQVYQDLPQDLKEAVDKAARETEIFSRENLSENVKEFEQKIIEQGIVISEVDKEAFAATVEGMEEKFPHVKKWIEKIRQVD